jgi:uncharacterized phage-associated protein
MSKISASTTRQKLINAIIFFASNTQFCGKIKLFKLLYLMDFEHFSQTGKSITGFEYEAWKFGPVPTDLMEEWEEFDQDLAQSIHIVEEKVFDYERQSVKVNDGVVFNDDPFTPRQIRIMQSLADKYNKTYSPQMIDVTHEQNGAWDKVWQNGLGSKKVIPYTLVLPDEAANRAELINIGARQRMYQNALIAARQLNSELPADY